MNKNFLTLAVFGLSMLFASNTVSAQSKNIVDLGNFITEEMSYLNMTPTQSEQVFQINLNAAVRLSETAPQAENLKDFAKVLKGRNLDLQQILSPEQFQIFQENKIIRAAIFRTIVMVETLDLSQDQLDPVLDINLEVVEKVRRDLDAYYYADSKWGKRKVKRKFHKSLKNADTAFDQVLSPQQIRIYHENVALLRDVIREEYQVND